MKERQWVFKVPAVVKTDCQIQDNKKCGGTGVSQKELEEGSEQLLIPRIDDLAIS